MANTLLTIAGGAQAQNNKELEVYVDLDIRSKFNGISADPTWQYGVSKLVNVNSVKNSVKQIFSWVPGERVLNPEFGSRLTKYLYEPITEENQERIVAEIKQCILRWEPRIIVDRVVNATTTDDTENNTVKLDIYYKIKGLDDRQFMYQYEYSRARYSYI